MDLNQEAVRLYSKNKGKLEVVSKTKIKNMHDLAASTPQE